LINGFYSLLNGHLSPDLVEFEKIEALFLNLKNKAEKHGLTLVASHPAELYQYDAQFISYTNTSTDELVLVVYITPPVFRPGASFTLKKITFLPIAWEGVNTAVTLNEGKDIYIAQNAQNSMSQVLSTIDDCKKYRNFFACPNTGVHFKDNDKCVLAILEGGDDIFENCPFSTIGAHANGLIKQIEGQEFVIFASENMLKLKVSCKEKDNSIDYRNTDNVLIEFDLKKQALYHLTLPEQCTGDLGPYYLTSAQSINEGTYQTINFDFIMTRNGSKISDVLKGFNRDKIIDSLQELNTSQSISYNSDYVKNKLILSDIKRNKETSYVIIVSTISTMLFIVVLLIAVYLCKKTSFCAKNGKPYYNTRIKFDKVSHAPIVNNESNPTLNNSAISFPELEENT